MFLVKENENDRWPNTIFKMLIILLIFALILSGFSFQAVQAQEKDEHSFMIEQISGLAHIQVGGGNLVLEAFAGMKLREGDTLITEAYSSVELLSPVGDRVTVLQNSKLTMTKLNENQIELTSWVGEQYVHAAPKVDNGPSFKLSTPSGELDIVGTHFLVGVDPASGQLLLSVFSGVIEANNRKNLPMQSEPQPVFPGQQIFFNKDQEEPVISTDFIQTFLQTADPQLIEQLLLNKSSIEQENEEMLEQIKQQYQQQGLISNSPDQPLSQEEEENFQTELGNLINLVLGKTIAENKMTAEEVQRILEQINQKQQPTDTIDLDLGAARADLVEKRKQQKEEMERLLEERKRQQEEQKKRQEDLRKQQEELLDELQKRKQAQAEQNRKIQEEKRKQAEERYLENLEDEKRAQFEEQRRQRESERQQMEEKQQNKQEQMEELQRQIEEERRKREEESTKADDNSRQESSTKEQEDNRGSQDKQQPEPPGHAGSSPVPSPIPSPVPKQPGQGKDSVGKEDKKDKDKEVEQPIQPQPPVVVIKQINDLQRTVLLGEQLSLPTSVVAQMSDGTIQHLPVEWLDSVDTSRPGTYQLKATVIGYDKLVSLHYQVLAGDEAFILLPKASIKEGDSWIISSQNEKLDFYLPQEFTNYAGIQVHFLYEPNIRINTLSQPYSEQWLTTWQEHYGENSAGEQKVELVYSIIFNKNGEPPNIQYNEELLFSLALQGLEQGNGTLELKQVVGYQANGEPQQIQIKAPGQWQKIKYRVK